MDDLIRRYRIVALRLPRKENTGVRFLLPALFFVGYYITGRSTNMKITRKAFKHPDGCWSKGFLWWGNGDKADKGDWVPKSLSEVHQDVIDKRIS